MPGDAQWHCLLSIHTISQLSRSVQQRNLHLRHPAAEKVDIWKLRTVIDVVPSEALIEGLAVSDVLPIAYCMGRIQAQADMMEKEDGP